MTSARTPEVKLQRGKAVETIARAIRNDIESGVLAHGEKLPSTRALASEWGTSPPTISGAIRQLAAEGLVVTSDRSGSTVHNPPRPGPAGDAPFARPTTPRVLLIGGYPGSGKSELARIVARASGWAILDKDTLTRAVVEDALQRLGQPPHDRESDVYRTGVRPAEYEALLSALTENVECGNSAVVSAPFISELNDRAWCDRLASRLDALGAELHVVWIRCEPESMHTYLRHRGAARDTAKLADWDSWVAGLDLDYTPALPHRYIDNNPDDPPLRQQANTLLAEIAEGA